MSSGLNLAQQEAVNFMHGPCLVLAGAGSGKTRVITHKIARLIQAGMEPKRIAAITFTNKAAAEMRERAKGLIGRGAKEVLICTFHALGVRMMRQDGAVLGLKPQFSILDSDDVTSILKDCGGTTDAATARQWQWAISLWKNSGLNAAQAEAQAKDDSERITARIMARYEERLSAYQSVDFDDLIGLPLKLLARLPGGARQVAGGAGPCAGGRVPGHQRHAVRGAQAPGGRARRASPPWATTTSRIYGWRGATLDNLKRLPQDFPAAQGRQAGAELPLHQRHPARGQQRDRPQPQALPQDAVQRTGRGRAGARGGRRQRGARGRAHGGAHPEPARRPRSTRQWQRFRRAVPRQPQAKPFEKALRRAQIPYKVSGGQSFFDRAEIKDLCAWFRLWVNNDDDPAFLRAITSPKRGIGHQTLQSLGEFAGKYRLSLFEALFSHSLPAALPARAVGSLHEFGRFVNDQEYRARHTHGAGGGARLPDRLAERHRLREAPLRGRGEREGRRRALDQRDRVLRLDGRSAAAARSTTRPA